MKIYLQRASAWDVAIVMAELAPGGESYRVHHAENGYSVWPADQFEDAHRPLTRREAQLINQSVAELEVMAISDPGDYNVLDGTLSLVDGRKI